MRMYSPPSLGPAMGSGNDFRGFCNIRAQVPGVWRDPYPAEIQAVRVPAGHDGDVSLTEPITVVRASEVEQVHFIIGCVKVAPLQLSRKLGASLSMTIVHMLIEATCVMEKGKQFGDVRIGTCCGRQHQAVDSNPRPVGNAVMTEPVDLELSAQVLDEVPAVDS